MKSKVRLRQLKDCSKSQQLRLREIRNLGSVRNNMFNNKLIELEEHVSWIEKISDDNTRLTFVILSDEEVLGLAAISEICQEKQTASWAFYLDEEQRGGLGAVIEFGVLNYAFEELGLESLDCEVLETNPTVIKLHSKFGFSISGERYSSTIRQGVSTKIIALSISRSTWEINRPTLKTKLKKALDRFDVEFE